MHTIFIGTIIRSGGSLLARLFDGHPDVASYPFEFNFPIDHKLFPIVEGYTNVPMTMPGKINFDDIDVYELLNIPRNKPDVVLKLGRERSEPLGARKNYLEKAYYGKVETGFDYEKFIEVFDKCRKGAGDFGQLMEAKHKAYFSAWDKGSHSGNMKYVVWHASAGIYLTNIEEYLSSIKGSYFINITRDIMGHIASEKTRLARRYYGSRRFPRVKMPNALVKGFHHYDLEAHIRAWSVALTRIALLQERIGVHDRFLVCRYENLLNDPEYTMREICNRIGLEYNSILITPTIAGIPWHGNSHQGKQNGINKNLASYYPQVLSRKEIDTIERAVGPAREYLGGCSGTPVDLTSIPKKYLYDYEYQSQQFDDVEKLSMYYTLVNNGRRKVNVKKPDYTAIVAYLYGKFIHLIHLPRLLKLKFFPGLGRQNYT